ncbi:hypothetical protein Sjap_015154 [Stephania japonica]|uniref:Uncharacterized protein n=1 Tax=Stephania japonica TaxID=461633 RepID=A0AAP0IKH3_9MAGN
MSLDDGGGGDFVNQWWWNGAWELGRIARAIVRGGDDNRLPNLLSLSLSFSSM